MNKKTVPESAVAEIVNTVKQSRKYGDTAEATIRQLAEEALHRYKKPKQAIKAVRKQLHSIMAPYLGDPDYDQALLQLTAVFATGDPAAIKAACYEILQTHLSTRERLPLLGTFFREIFAVTGQPRVLLDIACGLNPLAYPWMVPEWGTAKKAQGPELIYAYDIHEPRIEFLNGYFRLQGLPQMALLQDVALQLPRESGDVALFLKEMPRFSRNYGNLGRPLLDALDVKWLVISYPAISTHGGRNLTGRYREFMAQLIDGTDWPVTELLFEGEIVFCIRKKQTVAPEH